MATMPEPLIVAIKGESPEVHPEAWVAPNAALIGRVSLAERASVWYSATLRAEFEPIEIGAGSNIQDGVTVHVDPGFPARIGAGVTVGHNAVLHGCTIEDTVLVGMSATVEATTLWWRRDVAPLAALLLAATLLLLSRRRGRPRA